MDKEYLKGVYNYLNEQGDNYYLAVKKSQKADIEDRIRLYSKSLNGDLYIKLNEGRASGLFEPGFFKSDLSRSLSNNQSRNNPALTLSTKRHTRLPTYASVQNNN